MNTTDAEQTPAFTPAANARAAVEAIRLAWSLTPGAPISDADRRTLMAWTGWGALAPAFDKSSTGHWRTVADDLDDILSPKALEAASNQVDTSFYTPKHLTDAVYDILTTAGFTGGRVLEPGCGSGRFMAAAPDGLDIDWTGVEIDPTAARFAQLLNPEANIIAKPLEKTVFVTGGFDAVVGNVPFSSSTVFDSAYASASLHEYFLIRALDAVREGGYVIAITSRFTMDAAYGVGRLTGKDQAVAGATLLAALRLPAGAFASEGTDVVADILVFRKRAAGEPALGWDDAAMNTVTRLNSYSTTSTRHTVSESIDPETRGIPTEVNAYWREYPEHVAGTMKVGSYFRNPLTVVSTDPAADIARAVAAVKTQLIPQTERTDLADTFTDVPLIDAEGRKEGSFHVVDDTIVEVINGVLTPIRNSAELRALIRLRDAATALVALESDIDLPDSHIEDTREAALAEYQSYFKTFGALNRGTMVEGKEDPDTGLPALSWRRPTMAGFRRDPDYSTTIAMEEFDQDEGTAVPAAILLRRVNKKPVAVESVETAGEALAVSLGETGTIRLNRIAQLLGLDSDDAARHALGDLVYVVDGRVLAARDYLSGNIREKLAAERRAAVLDPSRARNVAALEAAMPADLGALEIKVTLGAPWIPAEVVAQFAKEILGAPVRITHTPAVSTWEVSDGRVDKDAALAYGTGRATALQLLDWALNGKTAVIYDENWNRLTGASTKTRNVGESMAASEKMRALDDRFGLWIWEDDERAAATAAEYNRRFNSHVARVTDGSHLTFPGLADGINLWAHQRDAVDRIISQERTLIGHPVGAGKTLELIATAMTLKRLGLATKPMIAVPNHLLEQIVREAQQAYPTGKFLIASREDLAKDRRRVFAARAATGDWDAIVMTHQALVSLPLSPAAEAEWVENQKAELRSAMQDVDGWSGGRGSKAIARSIRALEARLTAVRAGVADEDQVLFEHLGVDHLMVDEAHLFRRLATGSTSRDNGFSGGSSKRATDLLMKIESLAARRPGAPVASLFTGTPWANTLVETWVWQRYLQPEALESAGVISIEPWIATFVKYENAIEVAPDGNGFRMNRRPVGMKNLPELVTMLSLVADIRSADSIGLERPTHTLHNLVAQPAPGQLAFVKDLAVRADGIRGAGKVQRPNGQGDDSMLLVCNDGRAVALDPQLVGIDEHSPKVALVAATMAEQYHANADRQYGQSPVTGAFQLGLLDLGTPHPGDSRVYGRLRSLLVGHGVPAAKIRFVHEAKTDKARSALFAQCRDGSVSILLGSTSKVGIGTNIQTRLLGLHHVDAPWTPAEVEQREGRGLRPKNLNAHVNIFRYVTEKTFDSYMWQALERKARSFAALYAHDPSVREVEDIGGATLSFGEVKALAAGNPLLLDQAKVAAEIQRLKLMRSVHLQGVNRSNSLARQARSLADKLDYEARYDDKVVAAVAAAPAVHGTNPNLMDFAGSVSRSDKPSYRRYPYRGLNLVLKTPEGLSKGAQRIALDLDYQELQALVIKPKFARSGIESIAEYIATEFDLWIDNAAARATKRRAQATTLRAEADDHERAGSSSVFAEDGKLAALLAKAARIESEIEASVESPVLVAA
jgi:N12 class adenine-specific DNA methylase/SAM-dependent methyltransferase